MKRSLLFILICISSAQFSSLLCQAITYSYDPAGNRTEKVILLMKSSSVEQGTEPLTDKSFHNMEILIYPNPTKGNLIVEIKPNDQMESFDDKILFSLYDVSGRLIKQVNGETGVTSIDLHAEKDGMYLLIVKQGEINSRWKVIKR
jgi:hypothetical protein